MCSSLFANPTPTAGRETLAFSPILIVERTGESETPEYNYLWMQILHSKDINLI